MSRLCCLLCPLEVRSTALTLVVRSKKLKRVFDKTKSESAIKKAAFITSTTQKLLLPLFCYILCALVFGVSRSPLVKIVSVQLMICSTGLAHMVVQSYTLGLIQARTKKSALGSRKSRKQEAGEKISKIIGRSKKDQVKGPFGGRISFEKKKDPIPVTDLQSRQSNPDSESLVGNSRNMKDDHRDSIELNPSTTTSHQV